MLTSTVTRLPLSVTEYDFATAGIPFLPVLRFYTRRLESDTGFFISPDLTNWSEEEEEEQRDRAGEAGDGSDGDDTEDEDGV